jgi:hypothetical protein
MTEKGNEKSDLIIDKMDKPLSIFFIIIIPLYAAIIIAKAI